MEMLALGAGVPADKLIAARQALEGTAPLVTPEQRRAAWLQKDPYFFRKPEEPPNLRFLAGDAPKKRRPI